MAIKKIIKDYRSGIKEDSYKGKYLKNLSSSFLLNIGSVVIVYFTNLVLTNVTDENEYGAYTSISNWASIVALFAPMGLNTLILRQLPEYKAKEKYGFIKGINRFSTISILIFSSIISIVAIIIFTNFNLIHGITNNNYIIVGFCCVPLLALLAYFQSVLNALKHIGKSLMGEKIIRPILIAGGSALLFFMYASPDGGDLINLFFISGIIVLFIAYYLMQRGIKQEIPHHNAEYERMSWLRQGWMFVPISALSVINARVDISMIGFLMDDKTALREIAHFNVANKAAQGLSLGLLISNYVLGPSAAELFYTGQKERLQNIVSKTSKMVLLLSLPLFIGLITVGFWLLGLYGKGYNEGYTTMLILSAGQFVNVASGPVGYLLLMTKNEKYTIIGMGTSLVLNILLNLLLISDYGIEGVAVATSVSLATWNLIMLYFLMKKTGLNSTAFSFNGKK